METKLSSRNYGVDLLRVVAMLYVVTLHTIGPGGILTATQADSVQYHTAWFMEIWCYCAVDIFALISGYVAYTNEEKPVKWSNYLLLWLQVVAYGIGVALVFYLVRPTLVSKQDFLYAFFPVTLRLYWYVTAYTGLFLIIPLLNAGLRKLSEPALRKLTVGLILAFSFHEAFFQKFLMEGGYSFVWLVVLYILGVCIKKCNIGKKITPWQAFGGIVILCILTWWWKIFGIQTRFFSQDVLVSYVSPTVLGCALLHLIWFSKLSFGPGMKRVISFAAPAAFAAYILNCHKLIWAHVVAGKSAWLATQSLPLLVGYVIGFSLLFVGISILIDRVRIFVFDLLRLRKAADRFTALVDRALTKLTARL